MPTDKCTSAVYESHTRLIASRLVLSNVSITTLALVVFIHLIKVLTLHFLASNAVIVARARRDSNVRVPVHRPSQRVDKTEE